MTEKLLPCPFCGAPADDFNPDGDMEGYSISCSSRAAFTAKDARPCPMNTFSYANEERAIEAWNRRVPRPTIPEGWKLVPVEPTEEMIVAFVEQWYCHRQSIDDPQMDDAYQAMLAAAPKFGEEE